MSAGPYTLVNHGDHWQIQEGGYDFAVCNSQEQALRIIDAMIQQAMAEYNYTCDPECHHVWAGTQRIIYVEFCLNCGGVRRKLLP